MSDQKVERFLKEFTAWAKARADILAVALVGSQANDTACPDSDVDLVIIADRPAAYLEDTAWVGEFGVVAKQGLEDYGLVQSLRVFYRSGLEVEYGFTDERWVALPLDEGTRQVIDDGLRVLFECELILSKLSFE